MRKNYKKAFFQDIATLKNRPPGFYTDIIEDICEKVNVVADHFVDVQKESMVYGAAEALIIAGYKDRSIEHILERFILARCLSERVPDNIPCFDFAQDFLWDLNHLNQADADKLEQSLDEVNRRAMQLITNVCQKLILEYGGQEELDKLAAKEGVEDENSKDK